MIVRNFCATALIVGAMSPYAAASEFYTGKTIRIIVGSNSGGGYDQYARMLARHMPKHIPGKPTSVVINMPGAGGLTAANHLFNVAEKDGTVIATVNRFIPVMPHLGIQQARLKGEELNWIGTTASYTDNSYFLFVNSNLPVKAAHELREKSNEIAVGVVGTDVPAILKEALGLNLKLVTGYKSQVEVLMAIQRGELDGTTDGYISLRASNPELFEGKLIRPLVQFGRINRLPDLADVPTARELARTPEDRALIEFAEVPLMMARPFAAPPGVPKDRVEILRSAFGKTMNDPEYLDEAKRSKSEHSPKEGAEVQEIVDGLKNAPPSILNRYMKAVGGKPTGG